MKIELLLLFIAGGAGAIAKEIFKKGFLVAPQIKQKKIFLGFIGSLVLGGLVGIIVDHSPLTAFFGGYTGFSLFGAVTHIKKSDVAKAGKINIAHLQK
jgi:hypothetical protein